MGTSYREGHPLVPRWLVVALENANAWPNYQAMQVIQFLINPLCAVGLARQFAWLLESRAGSVASTASPVTPTWVGNDEAHIPLGASQAPTAVLFKESIAPGWSATMRWTGGSRAVTIEPAEMDFMLVRVPSVPAGAELVFHYGPTVRIYAYWVTSALMLLVLLVWLACPRPVVLSYVWAGRRLRDAYSAFRYSFRWESDDQ
jgi:hypothetical protein